MSFSKRKQEDFNRDLKHIREAYSVLIDQNQLDMYNLKYRTIEGEWVEPGIDDLYIQLTADSFRFKGLEKQMLDLHQFPQNMEALREIYATFGPVLLIDNQININDEEYEDTDDVVVNLTRTVKSMNANGIDFLIKKSKEEFLETEFEGLIFRLPYLVKDEDSIIQLYVNDDTKAWARSIAEFLGNVLDAPQLINPLNQALLYSDEEGFEDRYTQLCGEGKFSTISYDSVLDIVMSKSENIEQSEEGPESESKTDRTPIIREPTTDTSDQEEDEAKDKSTSLSKKKRDMKKRAAEKLKVRKRRKGTSTQEIGDAGEEIVKEHLEENGWKVINRNEFYGKAVEGSDLIAEKDGKKRIIEVKATENDWTI